MYDYISGQIKELNPTYVVIDNHGVGYYCHISLSSYTSLKGKEDALIYIKEIIREDVHDLYGFLEKEERTLFTLLISVSGVGANTARVILSSLSGQELEFAIGEGDVNTLKSVKGIGLKTAQRIIVELKDKIQNVRSKDDSALFTTQDNSIQEEALSALTMLGFNKGQVQKVLKRIGATPNSHTVESLIKEALKLL